MLRIAVKFFLNLNIKNNEVCRDILLFYKIESVIIQKFYFRSDNLENNKAKLDTHPFFALSIILVIVGVAANFIPSGQFVREEVDGRTVVDPNSFIYIDNIGIGIGDFFYHFIMDLLMPAV